LQLEDAIGGFVEEKSENLRRQLEFLDVVDTCLEIQLPVKSTKSKKYKSKEFNISLKGPLAYHREVSAEHDFGLSSGRHEPDQFLGIILNSNQTKIFFH